MWCYQKPGFEALLLAELQKQQQCSQFCDTLLKTEGISVPAHSCILSAISPDISSALSSAPPLPAGQSRLLEFRALGACTLLHMVRLLYCGEMAGEGENEKQEAISAAAKLGIHGLVEVTKRDCESRKEEGEGCHTEVGVQTELPMPEENGRWSRWRREVRDGSSFLWKETQSEGEKETWTQTEEQQVNTGPPSHPAASFDTLDMAAFQSFGMTDSHVVPTDIPYIPISLVYPPHENQPHQLLSAFIDSMQESTAVEHTSVPVVPPPHDFVPPPLLPFTSQATLCGAASQSCGAAPKGASRNVAAAEEWEDEQLEQFQGNIPGYISHFLKPDKEEGSCRGRARSRQGAGVGGARRAGTGERRARKPRARTGGRGRGGITQTVDVQEVGVSRLQKLFLQRWGLRASMTGQGGGAAGRKLYLKTRELLKPAKGRTRRSKMWEFSQSGDVPPYREGGGNTQRGRSTTQQFNKDGLPVGRVWSARAKPTTSVSFSSPHLTCSNTQTLSVFSPALQPSLSPGLQSAASSSLPPPSHEDHPEHFDRLLEEVMMGLDILPNNNNSALHSQPPLPTRSSHCAYASCGNTLAQNNQQGCTTGLLEANTGFHGSTHVAVARGTGSSSSAISEMPVLQQQGEGELNKMLDHFLQSFEQHVDSCTARDEVEMFGQSCTEASQPYTVLRKYRKTKTPHTPRLQNKHTLHPARHSQITPLQQRDETETLQRCSQPRKAFACSASPPKHTEQSLRKVRAPAKRQKKKMRKTVSSSDAKTKSIRDRGDKQLKQMPVVKLERSGPLPAQVTLHKPSCPEVQKPAKTKTGASSRKYPRDNLSKMVQPASWSTKMYPIRSRFREAHIMDSLPFLNEPLLNKRPPSAGRPRPGRPKKNGQILSFSTGESSTPPTQPQPVEPSCMDEQPEKNQARQEEELSVQPQGEAEAPTSRVEKRGAESEKKTSDVAPVAKRVCFERMAQLTSGTCTPSSESSDFVSEPATRKLQDVSSVGDCLQREQREEEPVWREINLRETVGSLMDEEMQSSNDEIIDVEGPTLSPFVKVKPSVSPSSHSAKELSLGLTGSWEDDDEDIDVIGGSSPAPHPVIISWTESSDEEVDEDVDVVGEKTDIASSAIVSTVSKE
ncbi:uncharacterized protein LOC116696354 isoform X2 [Etheostoma spectabile]|uniref:uncharacterized protein LOC116696354 isoform X2 n=1 Tax=Etheostoma spectabile TaxID=54343 RepID=UPI0013AFB803|nr:uncharacterized protein LOC116696354 isoform X2 [Etheostoma spectabile]